MKTSSNSLRAAGGLWQTARPAAFFLKNLILAERCMEAMNIEKIMSILPHRYPFLLVDRVVECEPGKFIRAYKNVSVNEPFFQGHFPGAPIMPGVLILEALAQTGGLLAASSLTGDLGGKLFLFTGLDGVKFRRQVVPGDRLDLECSDMRMKLKLCKLDARAFVDGKLACEAQITAALGDRPANQ